MKVMIISVFLTLLTAAKAEESDTPQGLSPPVYLDPPSETTMDRTGRSDSDNSGGSSGGSGSCGACGS